MLLSSLVLAVCVAVGFASPLGDACCDVSPLAAPPGLIVNRFSALWPLVLRLVPALIATLSVSQQQFIILPRSIRKARHVVALYVFASTKENILTSGSAIGLFLSRRTAPKLFIATLFASGARSLRYPNASQWLTHVAAVCVITPEEKFEFNED